MTEFNEEACITMLNELKAKSKKVEYRCNSVEADLQECKTCTVEEKEVKLLNLLYSINRLQTAVEEESNNIYDYISVMALKRAIFEILKENNDDEVKRIICQKGAC